MIVIAEADAGRSATKGQRSGGADQAETPDERDEEEDDERGGKEAGEVEVEAEAHRHEDEEESPFGVGRR